MKVFSQAQNATDVQVENGCGSLIFVLEKNTGTADLPSFFKDDDINKCDTLMVRYCSRNKGQNTIIPSLPVLPLAIASTTGPNHILCYEVSAKITKVIFSVQIGVNGALSLNDNSYLSVSTNFSDIKSLKILALDGIKTPFMYKYRVDHFNAKVQKELSLKDVNQIIMTKQVSNLQLSRGNGYMVNLEPEEIEDVARGLNDLMAIQGTEITYNQTILGAVVPVKGGLQATKVFTGGCFYDAIGASDHQTAYITSAYDDRVYTTQVCNAEIV